jgi:5-methylcytosine-specific restriction endonuclease McrA
VGKLKALKPALTAAPRTLKPAFDPVTFEADRRQAHPWRALYNTAAWRALRMQTFARDGFVCSMCKRLLPETALVCDHVRPHKGDQALFFDPANCATLCKPCHDGPKQAQERRGGGP